MPSLQLPPNPAPPREEEAASGPASQPKVLRSGRYTGLEDHELIHLLDSIDDEVARARFRESIYKSIIICMAIAWFIFYGPRVLFHQPEYKDLITAMKERDKQITYVETPRTLPHPPSKSVPDRQTLQKLRDQPRPTPPAPTQPTPQPTPAPTPQQQASTIPPAPPVDQPRLPLPSAPTPQRPTQALPDAPHPTTAQNTQPSQTLGTSMQQALQGARGSSQADYGAGPGAGATSHGPLQAGTQILSNTLGVDFTAYMRRLHNDIQRNWDPLIPEEVQAPLRKRGIVGIRFSILPDGSIEDPMILETRSGDVALDKAAWYAITSEKQFPPLPKEFHGPKLELRTGFYYNIVPPQ